MAEVILVIRYGTVQTPEDQWYYEVNLRETDHMNLVFEITSQEYSHRDRCELDLSRLLDWLLYACKLVELSK